MEKINIPTTEFWFSNTSGYRTNKTKQHYHESYELYFLEEGKCKYFIKNKTYEVSQGDLVIVPSGVIHRSLYGVDFHKRLLINCNKRFIPAFAISNLSAFSPIYKNVSITDKLKNIIEKIGEEYQRADEMWNDVLYAYMIELFSIIVRNTNQKECSFKNSLIVEEVVNYVNNCFNEDVKLSTIAQKHFVTPEHLSRTFKKETGFNFNEYVVMVRLRHAEKLLLASPKVSVTDVAYKCGFNDSNYFSFKFKKVFGKSPKQFAK